ncbi:alkaline phosphatase family protein [Stenotrophomonas ginsengisoli]|nr:ectonucleotide pyrophosphatase/phosphodiesterase [Stenotrophomonas ginsengisoli]
MSAFLPRLCLTVLSSLMLATLVPLAQASTPADPAVLMISIDGLHPDYITQAERYGVQAPVLRRFLDQGAYAQRVINVTPTVTYPNHTALVTGGSPQEHGIYTNTVFDPMGLEAGAWNWYGSQITAPTLWDAAKAKGMTTAAVLWPVSVGHPAIDYNVPEFWRNKRPYDYQLMSAVSTPRGFLQSVEQHTGHRYHAGKDGLELDGKSTAVALQMLAQGKPQLLTVHLVALDGAQHEHGPLNAHSLPVLEQVDGLVGQIVSAHRQLFPQGTVVIASDHGFHPVNHLINLNAAFAQAGLISLDDADAPSPKVRDWQAYAWNSGGSASVVLKDRNDTQTLARVEQLLARLAADPANGIKIVLHGHDAIADGALPQASFLVDAHGGHAMGGALTGPVVTPTARTTGTHGYRNSHPEMSSAFFITGPGIQPGRNLGTIDIRQIAPTLAARLGVDLPSARQPALQLGQQ